MPRAHGPIRSIDTRVIPDAARESAVLKRFEALGPGEHLELVSGDEPVDLLRHFRTCRTGQFTWDCRMRRSDEWLVTIGRKDMRAAAGRPDRDNSATIGRH